MYLRAYVFNVFLAQEEDFETPRHIEHIVNTGYFTYPLIF